MTNILQLSSTELPNHHSALVDTTGVYILYGTRSNRIYAGQSKQESQSYHGLLGRLSTHEKIRNRNNHGNSSFYHDEPIDILLVAFNSQSFPGHRGIQLETSLIQALVDSPYSALVLNKQVPKHLGAPPVFEECDQLIDALARKIPDDAAYQRVLQHTLIYAQRLTSDSSTISRIRQVLPPLLFNDYRLQRKFIKDVSTAYRTHVAPLV